MDRAEAEGLLENMDEDALFMDGYDDAILGIGAQFTKGPYVVYNREKCIQILVDRDGMSYDEAEEFFQFNTEGAWVGEKTPIIVTTETF